MPSSLSRLAILDLNSIQSSALCTHSPYFSPVQSLMLSIHIILGLPCPLFPSIFPSSNNLCIPFCQIKCLKYWSFLFFIVVISDLLEIVISRTSSLLLCSVHDILIILLYIHISNALVCFELPLSMSMSLNHKVMLTICNTLMLFFLFLC